MKAHDEAIDRAAAHRAILFSALGLAFTGGVELLLALYTGSVALLGDSLHNLADVSTAIVVFVGFRVSKRPPSRSYPYGYERAVRGVPAELPSAGPAGFSAAYASPASPTGSAPR